MKVEQPFKRSRKKIVVKVYVQVYVLGETNEENKMHVPWH